MQTYSLQEAKTDLSSLVDRCTKGETIMIAIDGKPLVKLVSLAETEQHRPQRLGFLAGQINVPDDFDRMETDVISDMFLNQ